MTEEMLGLGDPVIRRLQQAFSHEEPATELAAIVQRAARSLQSPDPDDRPAPRRGLTEADLVAARQREPAAVTLVYTAYAPALYRFFMAAVGDRHTAEDLTGEVFKGAIEGLPGFRGPVEALGGWLFRIARHDLFDFRRKQARSRLDRLDDVLDEAAIAADAGAAELSGQQARTAAVFRAVQAAVDHQGIAPPRAMLPKLVQRLLDMADRASDAPLDWLSPREREVLALLGRGWSNVQIGRELFISPHTVRTHIRNILQKLEMHSQLEAATFPMQHGWSAGAEDPEELVIERLQGSRVMAALQQLAPDQREVLLLRMVSRLTAPEVATAVGKTTGAVKALQHRGLASLAQVLGPPSPHEPPDPPPPSPDPDHLRSQKEQEG
jgi:RNA polymerase sigma factor (sigma-70 family)